MSLATDGPLIEFRAVSKGFPGVRALKDVSLSIGRAEIHALVGENGAGKSTLMNILGGQYAPDKGEVLLRGMQVRLRNPAHARKMGIGIVYQETRLCPALTVTENIFLGRERVLGGGKIVWQKMREEAARLLSSLAIPIDPDARVGRLSVADRQQVEVVRAISLDADAIVLDEPTSALSLTESERLFGKIRELRGRGISIIYISHRMEEVFSLADRISVLRDGQYLGTFPTRQTSSQAIVALIAGKELDREKRRAHPPAGQKRLALRVRNLARRGRFKDLSFEVGEGEILGIYGLQGAGRTELLETLFGLTRKEAGRIEIGGRLVENRTPREAIRNGFALLTEDRRGSGIFASMTVLENANAALGRSICGPLGLLRGSAMGRIFAEAKTTLNIRASSSRQRIRDLSGGNQQKVLIARWLATNPLVFMVDEPTRGIDVGAKVEIFDIIRQLRARGLAVLMVSSEIEEIVAECQRVLIMRGGAFVGELVGDEIRKENILSFVL